MRRANWPIAPALSIQVRALKLKLGAYSAWHRRLQPSPPALLPSSPSPFRLRPETTPRTVRVAGCPKRSSLRVFVPTASATFAHNLLLPRSLVWASISLSSSSRVQRRNVRFFFAGRSAGADASGAAGSGEAVAGAVAGHDPGPRARRRGGGIRDPRVAR